RAGKFGESGRFAGGYRRKRFEHVSGLHLPPSGGVRAHSVAYEQEIEQAFMGIDRVDEGSRQRHCILESGVFALLRSRVEHQRVALEELVLVFLHHRPAGAGVALPVDPLHRVARAVVAQREEFLRVADGIRERNAAWLELAPSRQRDFRQAVAARQRHQARRERQAREPPYQAERVGAADGEARHLDPAAPARREREPQLLPLARPERRDLGGRRVARQVALDQPAPTEIAYVAVPPVAAFLARLARAFPIGVAWAGIAEAL